MRICPQWTIKHDGRMYPPGQPAELQPAARAQALIEAGAAVAADAADRRRDRPAGAAKARPDVIRK